MMERENNFIPLSFFFSAGKICFSIIRSSASWSVCVCVYMCASFSQCLYGRSVCVFSFVFVCVCVCVCVCGLWRCGAFSRFVLLPHSLIWLEWEHTNTHVHWTSLPFSFLAKTRCIIFTLLTLEIWFVASVFLSVGIWTETTSPESPRWTSPASRTSGFCEFVSSLFVSA